VLVARDLVESAVWRASSSTAKWSPRQRARRSRICCSSIPSTFATSPVLLASYVGLDAGTGIVHCAPAYGVEDFQSWTAHGLAIEEMFGPVQSNGVYLDALPLFGGMHIWKANPVIVETIAKAARCFSHEQIQHSYMHCWRHKTPVIYRATSQFFVGMDIRQPESYTLRECAAARRRGDQVLPRVGQGASGRDDRQPAGLVHLPSAQLGRADSVLHPQGNRRAAPGTPD
jgi:isoleucyl-tRNA synthetase